MLTRREWLATTVALSATAAFADDAAERVGEDINATLRRIADVLDQCPVVARVDRHLEERPSGGLVQWRWAHFLHDLSDEQLRQTDRVNRELLVGMRAVKEVQGSGLDELLQEGLVDGKDEYVAWLAKWHRELIQRQLTVTPAFSLGKDIPPKDEAVERALNDMKHLKRMTHQMQYPNTGSPRSVRLSPIGKIGAGYVMSLQHGVKLVPAEDPEIDTKAAAVEAKDPHRSTPEWKKWVMTERNTHVVKLVRESRRPINHLLMGYDHDLRSDVQQSAVDGKPLSHLVVTVSGLDE